MCRDAPKWKFLAQAEQNETLGRRPNTFAFQRNINNKIIKKYLLKGALSDFCQTMLIFESTKTNTPIAQQDLALILKYPPHMYIHNHGNDDRGNKWRWHTSIFKQKPTRISCVKQSKINITHLSKRNNATSASASRPFCSLSSLHHWKAAPRFSRVLPLAWS